MRTRVVDGIVLVATAAEGDDLLVQPALGALHRDAGVPVGVVLNTQEGPSVAHHHGSGRTANGACAPGSTSRGPT